MLPFMCTETCVLQLVYCIVLHCTARIRYASTYQMLRGTLVLFAGCFTIVILRRRLYIHHWLGMSCPCVQ